MEPWRSITWLQVCISLLVLFASGNVQAHLLNMTEIGVQVTEQGAGTVKMRIDLGQSLLSATDYWTMVQADLNNPAGTPPGLESVAHRLQQGLILTANGQPLSLALDRWELQATSLAAIENPLTPQMAVLTFRVEIPATARLTLAINENLTLPWPSLIRLDHPFAQLPVSRLLTPDHRRSALFDPSEDTTVASTSSLFTILASHLQNLAPTLTWVAVGFQHIIPAGLDHIAFVLGLFFLSSRLQPLLWQVSCFTIAHSITLACATLGVISIDADIIEPLIAASIIYIALDNLYSEKLARWRLLVVIAFGLLHGLGFASALDALQFNNQQGLSTLLLFNLGVELGQIAVIALAFIAVGWLRQFTDYSRQVARPASIAIAGVGSYWLLKRTVLAGL